MDINYIEDENTKRIIAKDILISLPDWFGIPEATEDYIEDGSKLPLFAAISNDTVVGFITILKHFKNSAEIHVMGVKQSYHRRGVGRTLLDTAFKWCRDNDIQYLQVKTLSDLHPDKNYAATREFYKSMGFERIENFSELWGKANPCLMMMKYIY